MIAVTGIGVISPVGTGKERTILALRKAVPGISDAVSAGFEVHGVTQLGAVRQFAAKEFIPAMKARRMSKFSQMALVSAVEAATDAGLKTGEGDGHRIGVAVGTGLASTQSTDAFYEGLLREGPEGTNPMIFPETVQNIAASHISMHFGFTGPNITFSHSDISAELALFFGCELLGDFQADAVFVSGADELSVSSLAGYSAIDVLSDRMSPFGEQRKGFVAGEGAATLVLERLDDARRRDAKVYCTINRPFIASSPVKAEKYDMTKESMVSAMRGALTASGLELPDMISASANSTRELDAYEAAAIQDVFGSRAGAVPVCAMRSCFGYFQSDGMLRAALSALCLSEGLVPQTLGLSGATDCMGLLLRKEAPLFAPLTSVMVNSFAVGGSAASVVLRRPE